MDGELNCFLGEQEDVYFENSGLICIIKRKKRSLI